MGNYWWIIVAAIAVLVVLYLFMGKKKPAPVVADEKNTGFFKAPFQKLDSGRECDKYIQSQQELDGKINLLKNQMDSDQAWLNQIREKTTQSWHPCGGLSLDQCKKIDAIYLLKEQGFCIPENYR